jgi:DNA-binding NarL/FixJ family response regulator
VPEEQFVPTVRRNGTDKVAVLVCDPHPLTRDGMVAILGREPDMTVVGSVATAAEAIGAVAPCRPVVMAVTHDPPAIDGIDLTRRLARSATDSMVKVLLLVHGPVEDHAVTAFQTGVDGLLSRDTASKALGDTIRNVAAGGVVLGFPAAAQLLRRISSRLPTRFVEQRSGLDCLTKREIDVLMLVAKGYPNKMIAQELCLSAATVKSHLYHLCQKMGLRDRTQAVILAYETGLITACSSSPKQQP